MRCTLDAVACATFARSWDETVAAHASETFLVFEGSRNEIAQWTYHEFDRIVDSTAAALEAAGAVPGSAVHVVLKNCPAFVAVWLAAARIGATAIFADPASSARDIAMHIRRTAPAVALCGSRNADTYLQGVKRACDEGASAALDTEVIVLEEDSTDVGIDSILLAPTDRPPLRAEPGPHERLAVMFTSGTTSEPKAVVLTQCNYAHVARSMAQAANLSPGDRWLVTLPLFHANAQYYCFAAAIAAGASVALTSTFSASQWSKQAARLEATHASLFAAPIRMILARRPEDAPQLRLKHVWFAQSLAPGHFEEFAAMVGCAPRQLYGMTETVAMVTAERPEDASPNFIGNPSWAGRTTAIVDPESLEPVETGTPGLLLVAGTPGCDLFQEYLSDPKATSTALVEYGEGTWLRTGDLAVSDQDGRLRFVGRVDDVIKVSGENVSLTEVEATLAQAPGVLEVAVVPRPDPIRDVVPVAYVVPRSPETPLDVEELDIWASKNLPPQARPRDWHQVTELPRTSVGKIRRSQLTPHDA
ncbi:class I adenylate-forming enzyme family protein [Rhodococcus sp. 4CII]|uniref:class I adenylate-forming enzyme family protein n=1 Tax=Rhodococcus sp. 4CII TaxID=2834580 RepID=UPI00289E08DB|nr:class I adenylate-forming enzyme family protein [Rhodococcus sp. 4CII]